MYASSGPDAAEESKTAAQASLPAIHTPEYTSVTRWFQRDLPYGADVLLENVRLDIVRLVLHLSQMQANSVLREFTLCSHESQGGDEMKMKATMVHWNPRIWQGMFVGTTFMVK